MYNTVFFLFLINIVQSYDTSTLKLVHAVVRHGNRTTFNSETYPTDPYANETYHPFGFAQLTEKGKLKAYNVGLALRERYDLFLSDAYEHEEVTAYSTQTNRTKVSLQLLLDGLYSTKNNSVDWNSVLIQIVQATDHFLDYPFFDCPKFIKLYDEFLMSPTGISIQITYKWLFDYLSLHTGENVTQNREVLRLHSVLAAQEDWGFKLPSWTKSIWPYTMDRAAGVEFLIATYTNELKKLSGGFLLKKIIEDTEAVINKDSKSSNKSKKLIVYSAHDINLGYLLGALNVLYLHNPPFSSYLLIEIHSIENVEGVKVFYQDYQGDSLKQLVIPGCKIFCPFTTFVELLKFGIPEHNDNFTNYINKMEQLI